MTTTELVARWLIAFAITQLVECPIYVRGFRISRRDAFLASAITHPVVTLTMLAAPAGAWFVGIGALAEIFAVLAEAVWIHRRARLGTKRALVASIVANVTSSAVGGIVYLVTGWP
jgi:hypothetical protein